MAAPRSFQLEELAALELLDGEPNVIGGNEGENRTLSVGWTNGERENSHLHSCKDSFKIWRMTRSFALFLLAPFMVRDVAHLRGADANTDYSRFGRNERGYLAQLLGT